MCSSYLIASQFNLIYPLLYSLLYALVYSLTYTRTYSNTPTNTHTHTPHTPSPSSHSPKVVLQLPRGNLEAFEPRPLVLLQARTLIDRGDFLAALLVTQHLTFTRSFSPHLTPHSPHSHPHRPSSLSPILSLTLISSTPLHSTPLTLTSSPPHCHPLHSTGVTTSTSRPQLSHRLPTLFLSTRHTFLCPHRHHVTYFRRIVVFVGVVVVAGGLCRARGKISPSHKWVDH